jgi:hypothetical protein
MLEGTNFSNFTDGIRVIRPFVAFVLKNLDWKKAIGPRLGLIGFPRESG